MITFEELKTYTQEELIEVSKVIIFYLLQLIIMVNFYKS